MTSKEILWSPLIDAAMAVRLRAHAPYSRFLVGAALLTDDGTVVTGCNVENASYPACICAEQSAVVQAVARGLKPIACVVATAGESAAAPCGVCRQVLKEFADDMPILLVEVTRGTQTLVMLRDLLPHSFSFDPHAIAKTDGP